MIIFKRLKKDYSHISLNSPYIKGSDSAKQAAHTLKHIKGIKNYSINIASQVITIQFNPKKIDTTTIQHDLAAAGFPNTVKN